jgi:hypothetical protein
VNVPVVQADEGAVTEDLGMAVTTVLDPLVVVVAVVDTGVTLNVPPNDILNPIEIILLYLLAEMTLTLPVMIHLKGGVVRDMMTVLGGGHRRILGEMTMGGVIGEKTLMTIIMECVCWFCILLFRCMCYVGIQSK